MKTITQQVIHCLALAFALVVGAAAQPVVYLDNGGGGRLTGGGFNGPNQMQGWDFQAVSNLTVTHLGLFDGHSSGGYLEPHSVGLWDFSGRLLASADFPVGEAAPLLGSFRYVEIVPVDLQAGQSYLVGVFLPAPVSDYTFVFITEQARFYNLAIDPRISFGNYRADLSDGLAFPATSFTGYYGGFGPNLIVADLPPDPTPTPRDIKTRMRDELADLLSTPMRPSERARLASAIRHIDKSLNPDSWIDGSHLHSGQRGRIVFQEEIIAVHLLQFCGGKKSSLDPTQLQKLIEHLVGADRSLAATAIADAITGSGDADAIERAQSFISHGDADATAGRFARAIRRYQQAWSVATGL